jgi:hypothetical protein
MKTRMPEQPALEKAWIEDLTQHANGRKTSAANSLDAYRSDLGAFVRASDTAAQAAARQRHIAPRALVTWIDAMSKAGLAYSTIRRRVSALASIDRAWRLEDGMREDHIADVRTPQVDEALNRAKDRSAARTMRRFVVFRDGMERMIDTLDDAFADAATLRRRELLQVLRDRALILALYAGPLTKTEAATLHVDDMGHERGRCFVHVSPAGEVFDEQTHRMVWRKPDTVRRVEFEPDVDVRYDVDLAVKRWLRASNIESGYLFAAIPAECRFRVDEAGKVVGEPLHPKHLRHIVGRAAAHAGLPQEVVKDADGPQPGRRKVFGGVTLRSIRAGAVGDRVHAGESPREVMQRVGLTGLQDGLAESVLLRKSFTAPPPFAVLDRKRP